MEKYRDRGEGQMWDSSAWVEQFRMASESRDGALLHGLRRNVFRYTKSVVEKGGYAVGASWVPVGESPASTWFSEEIKSDELKVRGGAFETVFEVVNEDCLAVARRLAEGLEAERPALAGASGVLASERPLVLNMASRRNPGGGVEGGAGAQEECLFRSSNYYTTLYPLRNIVYPMDRNFGGIYSPEVTVFRGLEAEGYPLLERPFKVCFVAVAALNGPHLTADGDYVESERVGMINKIRTILNIALKFGHKTLVLSAFGCGAFRNPPDKVALLFKQVFEEPAYKGAFERVIFAIKSDHNDWHNANFEAFKRAFVG